MCLSGTLTKRALQFTTNIIVSNSEKPQIIFCGESWKACHTLLTRNTRNISYSGLDIIIVIISCRMGWARRVVSIYANISRPSAENSDFRCDRNVCICSTLTSNWSNLFHLILEGIQLVFKGNLKRNPLSTALVRKCIYPPSAMVFT